MKECTFTPVMATNEKDTKKRSKEEFLQDQQKFLKEKEEKLKKA
jgi:hypothetical protein